MPTIVWFHPSVVPRKELGRLLSDYLALDRARNLRRLMVTRFGILALVAALLETAFRGFSPFARLITVALCLFPPLWARIAEFGREWRLARRIQTLMERLSTDLRLDPCAIGPRHKKVVKSS